MELLVGSWEAYDKSERQTFLEVIRCQPKIASVRTALHEFKSSAIIVGPDIDDEFIIRLSMLMTAAADLQIIVLGDLIDGDRCERWMRRGCAAYLSAASSVKRVHQVLRLVLEDYVNVVDRAFYAGSLHARYTGPMPTLTDRELEVLQLVALGHRNADIAQILSVVNSTVEFHMRHTLIKLGARNRVEAVTQARRLGLLL